MYFIKVSLPYLLLLLTQVAVAQARTNLNFDENWRFAFGHAADPVRDFNYGLETIFAKSGGAQNTAIDPRFADSTWRVLNLPHDWAVELPFVNDPAPNIMMHGYKPVGGKYPATSIGWYRKHFMLAATGDKRRYSVQFDGIFRDAQVWVNGFYLGRNAKRTR